MKRFWHIFELVIDKLIPYALFVLLFIVLTHFIFPDFVEEHDVYFETTDKIVIGIFIIDLLFKFKRASDVKFFLKHNWIDIIAVFPFYLIFRIIEPIFVTEALTSAQSVLHTGVELEKEGAKLVEEVGTSSRYFRFRRFIRPVLRLNRFLKALPFFEKPTKAHKGL